MYLFIHSIQDFSTANSCCSKIHFWPLDPLRISHPPKSGFASVEPIVLWGAVWAAVLVSVVPAETDPEVSISWAELSDELLDDLLLGRRLHTQQLPSIPSAGEICLYEVQPPPELGEVGQLVAWLPFSCLAHTLTCIHTHTPDYKCQLFTLFFFFMCSLTYHTTNNLTVT